MKMHSFPASYHQERLWFIDDFENGTLYPASPVYHNLPVVLTVKGRLDIAKLEAALGILLKRHEALRTMVYMDGTTVVQVIAEDAVLALNRQVRHDLSSEDSDVRVFCNGIIQEPFLIGKQLLIRANLVELREDSVLVLVAHHLIADRKSMQIILNELVAVYNGMEKGDVSVLPELPLQYADFSAWQRSFSEETVQELMFFWREKLHLIEPLIFHTDYPREQVHIYESGILKRELPATIVQRVMESNEQQSHFFQAVFAVLMHKYTGQQHISLGTIAENRQEEGLDQLVGPVANLVVVQNSITGQQTIGSVVDTVAEYHSSAGVCTSLPFDRLVTELNPQKDMSRTALFDLLFHYEDHTDLSTVTIGNLQASLEEMNLGLGKYDFNMLVVKNGDGYEVHLTYNKRYYRPETAARLIEHYFELLSGYERNADIAGLDYVPETEKAVMRRLLDRTGVGWPVQETLVSLFEKQAIESGDNTALIAGELEMTYSELNENANRLADYLIKQHAVSLGDHIALLLPRDERQVIAMVAVLKCGAAYVPIDIEYPDDRVRYTLDDCQSRICITEEVYAEFWDMKDSYSTTNPGVAVRPQDLAYIIYTSGSTGQPKGVLLEHRNVVRLLVNDAPLFNFGKEDVWVLFHSYCFDFSVWEMYGALLLGGTLIVIPKRVSADPALFLDLLVRSNVTVLNQTPSAFYNLLHTKPWEQHKLSGLRYIIFGGEALHPKKLSLWNEHYPGVKLVNMYGITETTVHVTYKEITQKEIDKNISNIGVPIPTLSGYILDKEKRMVPHLVPGELWVGGAGLARGYLNQEVFTQSKFIANPFGPGRLYSSGDLVRLSSEGELEYIGRIDNQVKVRGFRIELGEVEKALLKNPDIREALVTTTKDAYGSHELVAYFTATKTLPVPELIASLKLFLPYYMLPAYCIQVDEFRLNNNGKIDRSVLPPADSAKQKNSTAYVAPRSPLEAKIVAIWEEILDRKHIGINDDFFALGGHSIKAIQILNAYQKEFGVQLTMRQLFENLILESHSVLISAASRKTFEAIAAAGIEESYPLSKAQQRLWLLSQFGEASVAYNMPACITLDSNTDIGCFKKAVLALIDRHESLRTVFIQDDRGNVRQKICSREALGFEIDSLDYRGSEQAESKAYEYMRKDAFSSFNLETGPLLRVALIQVSDNKYFFYYNLHHIISDGWSGKVISRDLLACYNALLHQQETVLPELNIQYKDYAVWQERQLNNNSFADHRAYWMKQFEGDIPKLNLMIARERLTIKSYNGAMIKGTIPPETIKKLYHLVSTINSSLYINLLGAVGLLLYKYSYQKELVIGTPVAGRMHRNLEDLVGFFVNTVALRLSMDIDESFSDFSHRLKGSVLQAFDYQDYPFDLLTDELNQGRDLSRSPLFDVMLVLNEQTRVEGTAPEQSEQETLENLNSKYDLSFVFNTSEHHVDFNFIYNTDLFQREDIEKMSRDFLALLLSIVEHPGLSGREHINIITEQKELLEQAVFLADINAAMSDDF